MRPPPPRVRARGGCLLQTFKKSGEKDTEMIISKKDVQIQFIARDITMMLRGILQSMRNDGEVAGEFTWVIGLGTMNKTLYIDRLSPGPLCRVAWPVKGAFKQAYSQGAASIVICQNKLSGNPRPSEKDKRITYRFSRAGAACGVNVLDHIIFNETYFFSFRQWGLRSLLYAGQKTRVSQSHKRNRESRQRELPDGG